MYGKDLRYEFCINKKVVAWIGFNQSNIRVFTILSPRLCNLIMSSNSYLVVTPLLLLISLYNFTFFPISFSILDFISAISDKFLIFIKQVLFKSMFIESFCSSSELYFFPSNASQKIFPYLFLYLLFSVLQSAIFILISKHFLISLLVWTL